MTAVPLLQAVPSRGLRRIALASCGIMCVVLAACSSPAPKPNTAATQPAGFHVTLFVHPTNIGQVVTLAYGNPVYVDVNEHAGGSSACTGSCAQVWIPLTTNENPDGATGIESSGLGTANYDGTKQVTYFGHRLYYDKFDRKPLDATGQGTDGVWYAILPSGQVLKTTA